MKTLIAAFIAFALMAGCAVVPLGHYHGGHHGYYRGGYGPGYHGGPGHYR